MLNQSGPGSKRLCMNENIHMFYILDKWVFAKKNRHYKAVRRWWYHDSIKKEWNRSANKLKLRRESLFSVMWLNTIFKILRSLYPSIRCQQVIIVTSINPSDTTRMLQFLSKMSNSWCKLTTDSQVLSPTWYEVEIVRMHHENTIHNSPSIFLPRWEWQQIHPPQMYVDQRRQKSVYKGTSGV